MYSIVEEGDIHRQNRCMLFIVLELISLLLRCRQWPTSQSLSPLRQTSASSSCMLVESLRLLVEQPWTTAFW